MQFGRFQTLRELHRSQHAILYAARRDGDADPDQTYAVKVYDVESVGLLESVAAGNTFIERALIQKKLADQGAKHWAPVLEMGTDDDPYYATELFPLTAQRVVNRQANVGEAGLFTVVSGVVRGLTELRETFRRAHGNLKLTNVLIGGDEKLLSPKTTRVMLTDPSIEAASAKDRSADLFAIGELIHQLVLREPYRRTPTAEEPVPAEPQWPVPPSLGWTRLGPRGQEWLDLCNWLLSPRPADRPTDLIELSVALHRLTPPKPQRVKPKWIALAAVPVVLAGVGVGIFYNMHADLRSQVQAVEQQWLARSDRPDQPLTESTAQDWLTRLDMAASKATKANQDAALRDVSAAIADARARQLHLDISRDSLFSYSAYKNEQAVLELSRRLEQDLSPEKWTRLSDLQALQKKYGSRGWTQPAIFLDDLLQQVRLSSRDLPAGVSALLNFAVPADKDLRTLEEQWAPFDANLTVAEKSDDKALIAFSQRLRDTVQGALRFEGKGVQGLSTLVERQDLAAQLAAVARSDWPKRIDRTRLADEVDSRFNLLKATEADMREWLTAIDQYTLVPLDPQAEPLAGLTAAFEKTKKEVARQVLAPEEQAQYRIDRDRIDQDLRTLADSKFVKKDVARGEGKIASAVANLQQELDGLRKQWVRINDPKEWLALMTQPPATASDAIKNRWRTYIARHQADVDAMAKEPATFKRVKDDAEAVRMALTDLDKQFPPVPPGLGERLAAAAWEKREQALGALSTWAVPTAGAPAPLAPEPNAFAARRTAAGGDYTNWCGKLRSLAKDFPLTKDVLSPSMRPDVAWATKEKAFWEDPLVQAYVKDDLARINALAAVGKMNRVELLTAIRSGARTEVAVAAYRRLGESAPGTPAWPSTSQELATELEVRNKTAEQINAIRDEAERKPLGEEWLDQGPIRWRRFTNLAVLGTDGASALQQRLATAAQYRAAMHPKRAIEMEKLDPAVRFNYTLYETRIAITDPTDAVVRRSADELNRAVAAVKDRAEVQELGKRLVRLNEPEPMSVDAKLLAPQPPETYSVALRDSPELKFVRIQSPGLRPFYLCTTELSVGQFTDLVTVSGNWGAANTLLGNVSLPGGKGPTPQRGPRAWERPASTGDPITRFDTWRYDTAEVASNTFVINTDLRQSRFNRATVKATLGGDPKYDHPMQQLPAQAAIYVAAVSNCRLPTSREWLAAYEIDRKAAGENPQNDWNLRDRTWQMQWDFTQREVKTQWPDPQLSGVFWPASIKPPTAVNVRPNDDHTLLFRVANTGAGTFQNLVGNVAELVCDQADDLDVQKDRKSVGGIQSFCKQHVAGIAAIGGSALSAPELELLRPYAVNSVAEPYADVGVRLAFTAPARSIAERLKWTLDEQQYLGAPVARAAQ